MKVIHQSKLLQLIALAFLFLSPVLHAQQPAQYNSSEILLKLKKFNVLGNVLYLAAHPDDENTRLITYMANEALMNTGYLSLTRGDGGQNLIGTEIQEELGVIRTNELLAARKIDGGKQFFSRAYDFGYSKTPEETMEIWERDNVLADAVWVIRKFRPDVIITRFAPAKYNYQTHGHHSASAVIAEEAFKMAGDRTKFPEQLKYVDVWQPKSLYWNTSSWFYRRQGTEMDTSDMVIVDVGTYQPLLGQSLQEIAAESRSQHKSQGFGASKSRGSQKEYLEFVAGEKTTGDIFDHLNTSWSRIKGGENIQKKIDLAIKSFNPEHPAAIVPDLISVYKELSNLKDPFWKELKMAELKEIISASLGLYLDATANDFAVSPGSAIDISFEAINRSDINVQLDKISVPMSNRDTTINIGLKPNVDRNCALSVTIPYTADYSQPYWLIEERSKGMFRVKDQNLIGSAENKPSVMSTFSLKIQNTPMTFEVPVVYKSTDPVEGEQYRPLVLTPPVFMNFAQEVNIFAATRPSMIEIKVTAGKSDLEGELKLNLPPNWKASPTTRNVTLKRKGETGTFKFQVFPPQEQSEGTMTASMVIGDQEYQNALVEIDYDHLPKLMLFPKAMARVVKVNIEKKGNLIGYIEGAGDKVPESLRQIGYEVKIIDPATLGTAQLSQYDAIVTGIRAYNTVDELKFQNRKLLDYVDGGGTLVVQYNTSHRLVTEDIGPYPFKLSRDRVTVEEAPVRLLKPDHPVLNTPNKITEADFDGWIQERGLYFPNEWDERYEALISSNDPGEPACDGGLLVADYGQGHFIYSGYSWFRELPAGVPGAFRLFANLVSYGN